jgi:hypothetical protein
VAGESCPMLSTVVQTGRGQKQQGRALKKQNSSSVCRLPIGDLEWTARVHGSGTYLSSIGSLPVQESCQSFRLVWGGFASILHLNGSVITASISKSWQRTNPDVAGLLQCHHRTEALTSNSHYSDTPGQLSRTMVNANSASSSGTTGGPCAWNSSQLSRSLSNNLTWSPWSTGKASYQLAVLRHRNRRRSLSFALWKRMAVSSGSCCISHVVEVILRRTWARTGIPQDPII